MAESKPEIDIAGKSGCDPKPELLELEISSHDGNETPYPQGIRLAVVIICVAAAVFLITLDETIITTAIPKITDEFNSLSDVGWYGSAYFLTLCSFQLAYGRLYSLFSDKTVFLAALAVFEVGSIICATAQRSDVFILGRAVAGLGSGGINAGYIIILATSVPLERRPLYLSSYSLTYGVAAVTSPIIGGALTTRVSWRWCFWINLPFGGATLLAVWFLYQSRGTHAGSNLPFETKLRRLDVTSTAIVILGVTCLLLSLQWGGTKYAWSSWRIILLLVFFAALAAAFIVLQIRKKDQATVPPRIICDRSVASSAFFVFTAGAALNVMEYYLPIYFQAIQGVTALQSGLRFLPVLVCSIIFASVAGLGTAHWGYYTPFMLAGAAFLSTGSGLISTWNTRTDRARWIGYQVVFGAGVGLGIQQGHTAAQTVLDDIDIPTATVIMIFVQILGGAIFISVAGNVFGNSLVKNLRLTAPNINAADVLNAGVTNIRKVVRGEDWTLVLEAYSTALSSAFHVAVGLASLSFLGALCTEWKSIKKRKAS